MKWARFLLASSGAMALLFAVSSQAVDFAYAVNNGAVTLTQYQGPGGAVVVPASINGMPVTAMASFIFSGSGSAVTNIALPSSLTAIGNGPFYGCANLAAITVDPLNPTFSSVDGVLFSKDQTFLAAFPPGRTGSYSIPAGVTGMGDYAFYFCAGLTNVTIPNSVTNIGNWSFGSCKSLVHVGIGNSVASIGSSAFWSCDNLTSVVIPDSVTDIKDGIATIGSGGAFSFCPKLTDVTIGSGVTNIGDYTFVFCGRLSSIAIPDSVIQVGYGALLNCTDLRTITVGRNAVFLDSFFAGCTSLVAINVNPLHTLYSSVDGVWFNKDQTTLIQYPPAKPGNYTIPNSVTNLGFAPFYGASGLNGITLNTNLTSVPDGSFEGCSSLTNVTLSQRITSIGASAFAGCTSLRYVTIPSSVVGLGNEAFAQCTSLVGVFFGGNAPALGQGVFGGDNARAYYLPGTRGLGFSYGGLAPALWNPRMRTSDMSFGVSPNGFGFNIIGTANIPLIVEAATNLTAGPWAPLQACTLTNSLLYFKDPESANYPGRFYRIRSP